MQSGADPGFLKGGDNMKFKIRKFCANYLDIAIYWAKHTQNMEHAGVL